MNSKSKHYEREALAAAIKGLSVEEHLSQKQTSSTRDPADDFAAWHERFRHELTSEFGDLNDEDSPEVLESYIRNMKKKFKLRLQ